MLALVFNKVTRGQKFEPMQCPVKGTNPSIHARVLYSSRDGGAVRAGMRTSLVAARSNFQVPFRYANHEQLEGRTPAAHDHLVLFSQLTGPRKIGLATGRYPRR